MAVNELDAKTRAVEKMKAEPGKEMATYQAAENQLLAIRAEQKQNLALARQESVANQQQNAMMGQAAELAASSGGGGEAVQAPVNAATQNVLAKYGAGPTISKSTQRTTQQVTKQNITINNYNTTTNNTTNNVPNTGPVQGRPVVVNRDNTGRFKVWVKNALDRQNEQAAIRDREYQRRENVLTRSANKMTRKLEAISTSISKNLDPRRQATTFGEQVKKILKLIGIGIIAANWPTVMDILGNIEDKVKTFLEYVGITGRDERKKSGADTGIIRDLKYILLGENAKEFKGGLFGAIKEFFTGDNGLLNTIKKSFKLWMENRSKAIKAIKTPDFSIFSVGDSIKGLIDYLGQVFGAILEGPGGAITKAAEKTREEGTREMTTNKDIYHKKSGMKIGKQHVSYGDAAGTIYDVDSADAKYHVMKEDLKEDGSLKNNLGASLRQSAYLANNFSGGKATGGKINVSGILEGLGRLEKTAKESKDKTTLVDPKFIKALEKLGVNIESLNLKGKLKEYGYITRKKTEDEKAEEFAQNSGLANAFGWASGITAGTLAAFFASGGGINAAGSVAAGAYTGDKIKKLAEQWAQSKASEDYVFSLAPRGKYKDEQYAKLKQEAGEKRFFNYYELTSEDMQEIKSQLGKLTGRNEEFSYDAEDVATTRAMADLLIKKAGPNAQLSDSYTSNIQELAKLEGEYDEYKASQKEIWDNSVVSGMGSRAGEVGGKLLKGATTGYTESIGGDDDESSAPVTTKFKETTGKIGEHIETTIDKIKQKDSWDINKAVDTIKKNAKDESQGECLRYTANAINSGFGEEKPLSSYHTGSDPNMGKITSARYSGLALEALGFNRIPNDSVLKKGDIHVFQPSKSWIAEGHPHGHIEMFDGSKWYSDFAQKTSGVNWGHYSDMATYRWGATDGDIIDETAPLSPGNFESPTGIITSQEALAQNTTPIGDGTSHTPQNDAWAKANNMIWDEEEGRYIPNFGLDEVTVTPTSTTINTPLLAGDTGFTTSDIAKSTQTVETGNNSQGIENRLDVLIQATQNIEGISSLTAEATARNVDATTELAAVTAAKGNTPPPMSSSSPYTSGIPSGQV